VSSGLGVGCVKRPAFCYDRALAVNVGSVGNRWVAGTMFKLRQTKPGDGRISWKTAILTLMPSIYLSGIES
jgi:hypothetical protein